MRLWIFADFSVPTEAHIAQYAQCGFTDVVLGVAKSTTEFKLSSTATRWLKACELIRKYGMKPHFMVWAIRERSFIEQTFEVLLPLADQGDVSSLLFNAEGTWHRGKVGGAQALSAQAAANLIRQLRSPLDLGVVGFDRLHTTVLPLAKVCNYIMPEAYSFWKPGGDHWSHSWHTFPGPQQRRAYDAWWVKLPEKQFVMGLACYWGDRPRRGVAPALYDVQSMRLAMTETVAVWHEAAAPNSPHSLDGFQGAAYWSGKHLRGNTPVKQARRDFMQMLAAA